MIDFVIELIYLETTIDSTGIMFALLRVFYYRHYTAVGFFRRGRRPVVTLPACTIEHHSHVFLLIIVLIVVLEGHGRRQRLLVLRSF